MGWMLNREELEALDEKRRTISASMDSSAYTMTEIRAFSCEYTRAFTKARKTADKNLNRKISNQARSHMLCWDILKKMRRDTGIKRFVFDLL
jgi:hypothetical protein